MPKSFCCDHKPGQMIKKKWEYSQIFTPKTYLPGFYEDKCIIIFLICSTWRVKEGFNEEGGGGGSKTQLQPDG